LPPDALDAALSVAEQESLRHRAFLYRLLAGPAEARRQRALERRIREAHFRERTTLDGFDWAFNAGGVEAIQKAFGHAKPRTGSQGCLSSAIPRCERLRPRFHVEVSGPPHSGRGIAAAGD
jgi:hypothetical protein